uniref:Putative tick transposon n=1 Tax=Rhipicephalus pulchellus TaxID=72859 RepID=L7M070_RHIPC
MKEWSILRLIHSFVLSHITYVAAYHRWFAAEKTKLNGLIRRVYKQALGLRQSTSTELLLQLGLHNTLEELIEAQQVSQYERLSNTKAGRHILDSLGISYHTQHGIKYDIPREIRTKLVMPPLPKNMHPEHNKGRRISRARAMLQSFGRNEEAVFVDAARYRNYRRFAAAVVDHTQKCITSVSISTNHVETAEEVAIALAIAHTDAQYIISDSQTAVRNFANGRISPVALQVLTKGKTRSDEQNAYILWFPAHTPVDLTEVNLNEVAHNVARGLTFRASSAVDTTRTESLVEEWEWGDRLTKFNDITEHYKVQRSEYPPPHRKLSRAQSVHWRQLQTGTYTNPVIMKHIYPDLYMTNSCKYCSNKATLAHILWECPALIGKFRDAASNEDLRVRWRTAMLSSGLDNQHLAIQQAKEAAERQGLSADS